MHVVGDSDARCVGVMMPQAPAFTPMRNTYGAVWEASALPALPLDLQLTDSAGHSVIARQGRRALLACACACLRRHPGPPGRMCLLRAVEDAP